MRKLIYHVAVTLDGFIARQDGKTTGFLEDGEHVDDYLQSLKDYDTVIMGRKTYEYGYNYGLKPGQPPYPHMMHYVFSKDLRFDEKNDQVEIIHENDIDFVKQLKESVGSPIYLCGGGEFAGRMLRNGLIDELILKLNPIMFGNGVKLYGGHEACHKLNQLNHIAYNNGVHLLHYQIGYNY